MNAPPDDGRPHPREAHRRDRDLPLPEGVSLAQMAAYVSTHSGMPQVAVQEWAMLLRCRGARPVALEELVESLLQWFEQPLSAPEIGAFLVQLVGQGWLARLEDGHACHTTPLGEAVIAQAEPVLLKSAAWSLFGQDQRKDLP